MEEGGSAYYLPLMAGPIGLPFFPLGIFEGSYNPPEFFELFVWLTPDSNQSGYSFDPMKITVKFDNGDITNPKTVQVSRFGSTSYPDPLFKPVSDFLEPIEIGDSARLEFRFEKSSRNAKPLSINLSGLMRNGYSLPNYEAQLTQISKIRYLISGTTADNIHSWGDSLSEVCRPLFQSSVP
jgi:hypothetical protein